ncbi:unnamed protein product [Clavelina lepadiformis]|uniref:Uncharacterized protein n=1 Tax=Clavelina lepadiformis TaxID=159417 RepID=A0ABP0GAS3_CLALP
MNFSSKYCFQKLFVTLRTTNVPNRCFHVTPMCAKATAGRYKLSKMNNKPLTYDQAFKPNMIGVTKGWQSSHTGHLHDEDGAYERMYEDRFIRRFMDGTFHRLIPSGPVIKRRCNMIEVVAPSYTPRKLDALPFLVSYSERMLSAVLKCNVKIYIHIVYKEDIEYKYI